MDLWTREARLFKVRVPERGTELLALRGIETSPLSGGGKSFGAHEFLEDWRSAAGAIKSGGKTRRAAKMALFGLDHPDIEEFINGR